MPLIDSPKDKQSSKARQCRQDLPSSIYDQDEEKNQDTLASKKIRDTLTGLAASNQKT